MIQPATQLSPVMEYLAQHWTPGHPIGRSIFFAGFMFSTPWVDKTRFPAGISVLWDTDDDKALRGLSCALVTPTAAWHVYWHVRPDQTGKRLGGELLRAMVAHVAPKPLYVLGISEHGRPHYERQGFQMGVALRYGLTSPGMAGTPWSSSAPLDRDWVAYRYQRHPMLTYDIRGETIVREDVNDFGSVLHAAHLGANWPEALAGAEKRYDLVQAWAYGAPGYGWEVPPATIPSVFHPPEARGNTLLVAGTPHRPPEIHGSDGGQDRPA